jgi:hypothetical protein
LLLIVEDVSTVAFVIADAGVPANAGISDDFFSAIGLSEYRISDWQIRSAFFGSRHSSDY